MTRRWCHRLPTGEYVEARGVIASAIALGALAASATAGGGIVAGALQSSASRDAANLQVGATNKAADIQAKANAETLAFQKEQAAADQGRFEQTQHANYNQWAAREGRLSNFGQTVGLPSRSIPAYQSSLLGGAPQGMPTGASGSAPAVDASKGDIAGQVSAYFKARGVPDTETPYWVQKWSEFGQKDPAYFNQRLAQADIFGAGGRQAATPAPSAYPSSFAALSAPQPQRVLTPALQAPRINSFGVI